MISRNDALDFLQRLKGNYSNQEKNINLNIYGLGHGVILEANQNSKTILYGMIALKNQHLEGCFLIGFPNIIHSMGKMENTTSLNFISLSPAIEIKLSAEKNNQIFLSFLLEDKNCLEANLLKLL
ncbi:MULTISPECIES: hypothetical protein [unclassified Moraxella]|uniref:hypothetical protein n=1 Tax=unclassified Moraxella TaxID=2685852 RepID=UPI003AF45F96